MGDNSKFEHINKNEIKLGLDNMLKAMKVLGNPEKNYKILHIAGTNGKGSTAAFLEAGLIEAGYKTGKYTSPEIYRFNERITVNGSEISDKDINDYYDKVNSILEKNQLKLTYFEITTAMMFLYMKNKNIEYLVLETGLGGRTDATNVITPIVSLITNISLDHTEYLGDSLGRIAYEKSGIIKDNVPVFFADNSPELLHEIKAKTQNYVSILDKYDFSVELDKENYKTILNIGENKFVLSLFGKFQAVNFLLAYETLKYMGIRDDIIKKSSSNLVWKGRFQRVLNDPLIILDGAHNEDSAKVLSENLRELFTKKEVIFIISILKDKDNISILDRLSKASDYSIFTGITNERGQTCDEMYEIGKKYFKYSYMEKSMYSSLKKAFELGKKVIVICGSFYLLKEYEKLDTDNI